MLGATIFLFRLFFLDAHPILHCDEFQNLFPGTTKVKCLSDAGLFRDVDVAGRHTLRIFFDGVVTLQGAQKNLPRSCTNHLDPSSDIRSIRHKVVKMYTSKKKIRKDKGV
ncbi:Pectin acetylesterase 12 [Trifolium repens]|nr:Pectin acetylesterase 12 [Trifolium repens]